MLFLLRLFPDSSLLYDEAKMTNVLHLTHTDINSDSRILKEMKCVANISDDYRVRVPYYGLPISLGW